MKKIMSVVALLAMISLGANAQQNQRPSREEIQSRQAEMLEKRADKMATDFGLKGDVKDEFKATYKEFQKELWATQRGLNRQGQQFNNERDKAEKKELTEEEAIQQLAEYFGQQEEQIAAQQKRFEIEKKYYAKLQNILKPQYLVKVFKQRREQGQPGDHRGGQARGGRPGGFGGPQGGFGGPQGGFGGPQGGGFDNGF